MNFYLSQRQKIQALSLATGEVSVSERWAARYQVHNYRQLLGLVEKKRTKVTKKQKQKLSKVLANKDDVALAYWTYLARYPESTTLFDPEMRLSRWDLVEGLRTSEDFRMNEQRFSDMEFDSEVSEPKFVYLHIPKCGGTSFSSYCEASFPGNTHFDRVSYSFDRSKIKNQQIIGGHKGFTLYDNLKSEPIYISILRDPVDRAISLFEYYSRLSKEGKYSASGFDPENPHETMLKSHGSNQYLNNAQCRFLSGSDQFGATMRTMRRHRFIVSTIENMQLLCEHLASEHEFSDSTLSVLNNNQPEYNARFKRDFPDLLEQLRRENAEDLKLYQHVSKQRVLDTTPSKSVYLPALSKIGWGR